MEMGETRVGRSCCQDSWAGQLAPLGDEESTVLGVLGPLPHT